jgi:DNA-binding PadR family transcriptional regulator
LSETSDDDSELVGAVTLRRSETALALFGVDPEERRMVVLRALIKAQKDHESLVSFEEIKESFSIEGGKKSVSDPLLYRSLTSLEKDRYIIVDRTGYRHRYGSSHKVMRKGLKRAKQAAVEKLESKLSEINLEIENLDLLDSRTLAVEFMLRLMGKRVRSKPIFVEGLMSCFGVIEREICNSSDRRDIIRFTTDWMRAEEDVDGRLMNILECIGKTGAEIRILCRSDENPVLTDEYHNIVQMLHEQGHRLEMRRFARDDATYQFVSKSREGMILVVAETPLAATWISRNDNLLLIGSAIESFEKDYENAQRLTELSER